ncbi:MAG: hypothetical protein COB36_12725 [Alphaproteobacteria bacterium]|nr:MAG: hypothetical protein COB36_12725 [Alphaproteobacteria bacterium]
MENKTLILTQILPLTLFMVRFIIAYWLHQPRDNALRKHQPMSSQPFAPLTILNLLDHYNLDHQSSYALMRYAFSR